MEERQEFPIPTITVKKRRGAQPGNQNARKHGYFSKVLDAEQQAELAQLPLAANKLEERLQLERVKIDAIIERDPFNVPVITAAGRRYARMARNAVLIRRLNTDATLRDAITKALAEYGISFRFPAISVPENHAAGTINDENGAKIQNSREPKNESCLAPPPRPNIYA